ncbi:spermidine putrescine abc transporter permease component potb [hydrocarbon metagenome]|uniref:Spermidine putrescine abc transporter permease component potb n=1 Tax=hydrocarbon metagenome TaxID=938273 RepID=A0A0W8G439_9ZZZZ
MKDRSLFKALAVTLTVGWLAVFVIVPNLLTLATGFLTRGEPEFVLPVFTLENYARLFDPAFFDIFLDSVWLALCTTVLCLLVGYPFAYILARLTPARRRLGLLFVVIPFWTNSLIRTYALIAILNVNGLLNAVLLWLGIITEPVELLYTNTAVFIGFTYTLLPFMILPLYASIEKLDHRLIEAARDLGAGSFQTFFRVSLPLTLPGIIAGSMLVFLPALSMFYVPDILGGAKSLLVGNFIRNQFLVARDWPFGAAASVLLTVVMGLLLYVYWLCHKRVRKAEPA